MTAKQRKVAERAILREYRQWRKGLAWLQKHAPKDMDYILGIAKQKYWGAAVLLVLLSFLAGCIPSGLYLTDAQVLQLDRTIQKQADENERLRQAVLKECRQ